jgi:hypothetical protein
MAEWADTSVESYEEAVQVVLQALGTRIDPRKCLWCNYPVFFQEQQTLKEKRRKDVNKLVEQVRREIDEYFEFSYRCWYVGVPRLKIIRRGLPHLAFEIDLYYVASNETDAMWGKLVPKADKFEVPVALLPGLVEALSKGELEPEGAEIVERAPAYTIYRVNGYDKEWKVPDAFLGFLWALAEKGKGWEGLFDLWSCRVLERMPKALPKGTALSLPSAGFSEEEFIVVLTGLGLSKTTAKEILKNIPHDVSLAQAIRMALKQYGSGVALR